MKTLKKTLNVLLIALLATVIHAQEPVVVGVAINTDGSPAHPSAMLDVTSFDRGFLAPRLTQTQRIAIVNPAEGLLVYQTDAAKGFYYFDEENQDWLPVGGSPSPWSISGDNIHFTGGHVGIGTITPVATLDVDGSFIFSGGSGDVNGDGITNNLDAILVNNYVIGALELSREELARADVNADGVVDRTDAFILTTKVVNPGYTLDQIKRITRNSISISDHGDINNIGDETFKVYGRLMFEPQTAAINDPTDRLYNIEGDLFFNGNLISSPWSLRGNSGTDSEDNFIGTTDEQALVIKTNDNERVRITEFGLIGHGLQTPEAFLHIKAPHAPSGQDAVPAFRVFGGTGGFGDYPESGGAGSDIILTAGQGGSALGSAIGRAGNITLTAGKGGFMANDNFGQGGHVILRGGPPNEDIGDYQYGHVLLADEGGKVGIGTGNPLSKLHISAVSNPLRLEGLQNSSQTEILVVDANGVVTKRNIGSGPFWSTVGNSGTNANINFIGTTDNQPLAMRSNNTEVMRITPQKNVGIGTTTPGSNNALHVYRGVSSYPLPNDNCGIYANTYFWDMAGDNIGIKSEAITENAQLYGTQTTYGIISSAEHTAYENEAWGLAYGLYASAKGATTNWAGYFDEGNVYIENKLGIGMLTPEYALDIEVETDSDHIYGLRSLVKGRDYSVVNYSATAGRFEASMNDAWHNYAIYGSASGGYLNFAGYFDNGHVYIKNELGIGIDSPTQKLDINGQIRIRGGSPGNGKILTSDANGVASWQNPAVSGSGSASRVAFWSSSNVLGSDANLYWNNTHGRLGIGTVSPAARLDVEIAGTENHLKGIQAKATQSASEYDHIHTYGGYFEAVKTTSSYVNYQYGVYGLANSGLSFSQGNVNYGGYFHATGTGHNPPTEVVENIGVYGKATGTGSKNYAGYFADGNIYIQNNTGIGTLEPEAKLHVNGTIRGQYQSSDGTSGISGTRSWTIQINDKETETHTVVIKNGIIVSWDVLQFP